MENWNITRIHVLPVNDVGLHADSGVYCNCNPKFEWVEGTLIVTHNSFNGRELFFEESTRRGKEISNE